MAAAKKRKPAAAQTANEPEFRPIQGWTPARVDSARVFADGGDLTYAADLWERVMGDKRAVGPLQALCGIASLPFEVKSARGLEEDPIVEAFEEDWKEAVDDDFIGEVMRWISGLGVALVRVSEWVPNAAGRVVPVLECWNPRNLRLDATRKVWQARIGTFGGLRDIEPGDSEWILITPYGKKRPWARAPWFDLGSMWLFAAYAQMDWGDWNDNHSKPFRSIEQKDAAGGVMPDEPALQKIADKVAKLARGGTVAMPEGLTLRLVESSQKGWESFAKVLVEVWPVALAIALTGNNLSTEVKGGSYAATTVHYQVSHDRMRTFGSCITGTLRKQLWSWWAEFNFGDASLVPKYEYDCTPPSDPKAEAERFTTVSTGLKNILDAGVPPEIIDLQKMREEYGLPILESVEALPPKQPTSTQPGQPQSPNSDQPQPPPPASPDARAGAVAMLASGGPAPVGMRAGQDYADRVSVALAEEIRQHLAPHIRDIERIVDEADSLEEAQQQIATHYRDKMNASALAKLFVAAMQMSSVGGIAAVEQDAES